MSIFTNENEVIEGQKQAAAALGLNPEQIEKNLTQREFFAKANCLRCFGKGILTVVLSPCKAKITWAHKGLRSKMSGPTKPRRKITTGVYPKGDMDSWNTRRPEPEGFKHEARRNFFCKCVKVNNEQVS